MSEQDYELLSAYLDDMLTSSERETLETRLNTEPELRRELNALRQTVNLMRQLPVMKAPRNYALTADMVGTVRQETHTAPIDDSMQKRIISFPSLPLISALSSVAAVVLIALGIVLIAGTGMEDSSDTMVESAPNVAVVASQTVETTEEFAPAFANTGELSTAERLTASARTANDLADMDDEVFAEEAEMDTFSADVNLTSVAGVVLAPTSTFENLNATTFSADQALGGAANSVTEMEQEEAGEDGLYSASQPMPLPSRTRSGNAQTFDSAPPVSDESQAMMQIQMPTETGEFPLTATYLADMVLKDATETLIAELALEEMEEIAPQDANAARGANIEATTAFEQDGAGETDSDQTAAILLIIAGVLSAGVAVMTFWQSRRG